MTPQKTLSYLLFTYLTIFASSQIRSILPTPKITSITFNLQPVAKKCGWISFYVCIAAVSLTCILNQKSWFIIINMQQEGYTDP
jgi:hypothetical protein